MKSFKAQKLLAYFVVPVIFGVMGYLVLRVALSPVLELGYAYASLVIADDAPSFNSELTNIYNPKAVKYPDTIEPNEVSQGEDNDTEQELTIPISAVDFPEIGARYANLSCDKLGLNAPVYWNDTKTILRNGAGQSISSFLPGFGRVIILSAHNTSFFKPMKNVEVGDVFTFDTNYEKYEYTVTNVEILNEDVLLSRMKSMLLEEKETLILYTCYPFHAISGRKTDRLVAFCERTEGLSVKWRNYG